MFPAFRSTLVLDARGVTNGGTTTANIDTLGADFLTLDVHSTTSNNATNNPSVFKIAESDDTVVTNFADISRLVGDGASGWLVPNWHTQTADIKPVKIDIDLRHRKRYLRLSISPLTTQDFIAIANFGRLAERSPDSTDQLALVRA